MLLTLVMFAAASAAMAALWNRWFLSVPWKFTALFFALCAVWQAETLFTSRVDVPGNLAFHAYPWKVIDAPGAKANTGIVFTQLAPWTRIARDELKSATLPLWNRHSAGGAPLLANQQTAIFHPFTLLGLPLSVGKAFTLSASLRLFTLLFFTFVLLRGFGLRDGPSIFGAVAYAFCSFHVVWLLFPLGLATMMLPVALTGARELVATSSRPAYVLLTLALSLSVLGGHPESALWVWITTAVFIVYLARKRVLIPATAFIIAGLLTAFFWYPTLRALQTTERFDKFHKLELNPADHGLSYEWLLPLVAQNVLGNPVTGTYTPPRGAHPAVLNDYGEVASSYAGLLTLALALWALPAVILSRVDGEGPPPDGASMGFPAGDPSPSTRLRMTPLWFALGLMAFALFTIAELPLWRDAIRAIPLAGVSLHQRLRVLWDLGACIAAATALNVNVGRASARPWVLLATGAAFLGVYFLREPPLDALAIAQLVVPIATLLLFTIRPTVLVATVLVFLDLAVATWRYNPPALPGHVYPMTGAIDFMQRAAKPYRVAAWGWSFLPDTPGYYGLEDVKTTDPVQHFAYTFLLRGYLGIDPASPEMVLSNVERAYLDFLNVRFLYVPPDNETRPAGFVERYRGADGVVLENTEALPRYFFVRETLVETDLGMTVAKSRFISDFRAQSIVDRKPADAPSRFLGGTVDIREYEGQHTLLDVESRGWNLLVTSDTHWPGWKARVNGRDVEVVKVNGAFNGVFIPPGRARVELWYWPDEVTHGLIAGAVGLLLLAWMVARR
ncbi:MAG TPA: YfhO family protein [Thermoanaerobaculia bacterium]